MDDRVSSNATANHHTNQSIIFFDEATVPLVETRAFIFYPKELLHRTGAKGGH
jgi:hypothetical protein